MSFSGWRDSQNWDHVFRQVERLVERLRSSTLLEDRRDACRGLKAMSKKFRVEVGAQGMNDLIEVSVVIKFSCWFGVLHLLSLH